LLISKPYFKLDDPSGILGYIEKAIGIGCNTLLVVSGKGVSSDQLMVWGILEDGIGCIAYDKNVLRQGMMPGVKYPVSLGSPTLLRRGSSTWNTAEISCSFARVKAWLAT